MAGDVNLEQLQAMTVGRAYPATGCAPLPVPSDCATLTIGTPQRTYTQAEVDAAVAAERERCAEVCRQLWLEHEAAHGNRAGEYHNGLTAGLDLAERRIRLGA